MTLAALGAYGSGLIEWPPSAPVAMACVNSGYPIFSTSDNYRLDATRTKIAWICRVPKSGNITGVAFNLQAVTSDQPVQVGVYHLDSSGNPDTAAAYKGMTAGSDAISLTANVMQEITLGTQCTSAVAGDLVAIVFEWAGTQGDIRFAVRNGANTPSVLTSNVARYAAAAWTKSNGYILVACFKYEDGSYAGTHGVFDTSTSIIYNINSSGADEYGLQIPVPFKARCVGLYLTGTTASTATSIALSLYNGTTNLGYGIVDPDVLGNSPMGNGLYAPLASPVTLSPGTYIVAGITSSANNMTVYAPTVAANAWLATWPLGANCYGVKRLDGVSASPSFPTYAAVGWTALNTQYHAFGMVLDQLDDGAGAAAWPHILGA